MQFQDLYQFNPFEKQEITLFLKDFNRKYCSILYNFNKYQTKRLLNSSMLKQEYSHSQQIQDKQIKDGYKEHSDYQKIQIFYQAFDRLKKFVENLKSVKLEENNHLDKYIQRFQKIQKQKKGNELTPQDILKLVQEKVERIERTHKIKKNWSSEDRRVLHWVVINYARIRHFKNIEKQFTIEDWDFIASLMPGFSSNQCMFKWLGFHKLNLNEACWSQQQSTILKSLISKYFDVNKAIRWKDVCKKLYLLNEDAARNFRTPKQCKEHWNFRLNPNLRRQPWSQQEDMILLKTVKRNSGLKKWVQMVKLFNGRTQNAVKNRYNLIIQKERKCLNKSDAEELDLIEAYLQRCYIQKCTNLIEPDSQQNNSLAQSNIQVTENENSVSKKKKISKTRKISSKKSQKLSVKLQPQNNYIIHYHPIFVSQCNQLCKTQKQNHLDETSVPIKYEKQEHHDELISMHNLPQINNYNHRVRDIQFNFMYIDSSM